MLIVPANNDVCNSNPAEKSVHQTLGSLGVGYSRPLKQQNGKLLLGAVRARTLEVQSHTEFPMGKHVFEASLGHSMLLFDGWATHFRSARLHST